MDEGSNKFDNMTIDQIFGVVEGEISDLDDRVTAGAGLLGALTSQVAGIAEQLGIVTDNLAVATAELNDLNTFVTGPVSDSLMALADSDIAIDARLDLLEAYNAALDIAIDTNTTTVTNCFNTLNDQMATANTNIATNTTDISTLNGQVFLLQEDMDTAQDDITAVTLATATNTSDISTINSNVSEIETDLGEINTSLTTINSHLTTLDSEISSIEATLTTLDTRVTSLDTSVASLGSRCTTLETNQTEMETDITDLETNQTEMETDITDLETRMDSAESDINDLMADSHTFSTATWTNAALKAGTDLTLITAPAAGRFLYVYGVFLKLNYGGTNAFTNTPTITHKIGTTSIGGSVASPTTFWTATANTYTMMSPHALNSANLSYQLAATVLDGAAYKLTLSAALTGNAANNNTVTAIVEYRLMTT
ncbi:hypothetical protein [Crucivirus sp.]|nr:hypothetical protein [Crucivirus sp.]